MAAPPSRPAPDPTWSEIDVEPGIWLARRLLADGGLTIATAVPDGGRLRIVAETFVSLEADVVTRFVEEAARRQELVARHFERVERTMARLRDLRVALRLGGLFGALGSGLAVALPAQELLAAVLAADLVGLATLGVGAGGGALALLAARHLLSWLVRRRIGGLESLARRLAEEEKTQTGKPGRSESD